MSDIAIVEIRCRFGGGTDSPELAELILATDPAAGSAAALRAANGNSAAESATAPGGGENGTSEHGHTAYGTGSGGIPAPAGVPANGAGDARPEGSAGYVLVAEEARP
ncbi:hypothetical protein NLM24_23140 [Nocardia zapadnayensis]|uniref:hypothetical protein n=1 Tax=Nocardia rhamnosiphila TaxID=426716 RepID=UPI00224868D3|nr:hypothetical protein [Nocardia zapadnayensis]MCX0273531.1 hypothetical protein [Nocardia zapadnayensis]